jgi:hypothetical protein
MKLKERKSHERETKAMMMMMNSINKKGEEEKQQFFLSLSALASAKLSWRY